MNIGRLLPQTVYYFHALAQLRAKQDGRSDGRPAAVVVSTPSGNFGNLTAGLFAKRIGLPVVLKCPPNQTLYTCGSNAVAYYKVYASGNVGPVICTPPSGSLFQKKRPS